MQARFYSPCKCGNCCVPGCKCVKMLQSYIQCSGFGSPCSQLRCLGSLVGKSTTCKADGRGFESHIMRHPIFLSKTTVSGESLCCCCVVALPFSASLGVVVHAQYLVWGLVSC